MLTDYIEAAMKRATYEILPEDQTFYGEIPEFQGVWANEKTLDACRGELQSVLEDWLLFRIGQGLQVPIIGRLNLNPKTPRLSTDPLRKAA